MTVPVSELGRYNSESSIKMRKKSKEDKKEERRRMREEELKKQWKGKQCWCTTTITVK